MDDEHSYRNAVAQTLFSNVETGDGWYDDISDQRKGELELRLQAWDQEVDHGERKGPFDRYGLSDDEQDRLLLTGADVFWLAARALAGTGEAQAVTDQIALLRAADANRQLALNVSLNGLHLQGAWLSRANLRLALLNEVQLEGAYLGAAHLEGALLRGAHLEGAYLAEAHLYPADLSRAHLERANLRAAHLERTTLTRAHLEEATLVGAHLEEADLEEAHLERANLWEAHLERANLWEAHLEGADLRAAHLEGVNLGRATLDKTSRLNGIVLAGASLDQVTYDNVNLTVVDWSLAPVLGDELKARDTKNGRPKNKAMRSADYTSAVRANRMLAVTLRSQGLNEDADRFAYRAQVCQRGVHLLRLRFGRWLFSWLLFIVAGYGYRPLRTLFWYLASIGIFAFAYFQATHGALTLGLPPTELHPLAWYEALVLSVSSFHGRGFFSPSQNLGDPVAILAAAEAVFGLFIEVSFIATFTQRYFGK